MDQPDEQLQGAGGGNHPERTDFQLSLFPSENEQIKSIDEAESVKTPSAFSVSQADIDKELRNGSGFEGGKLRIYAMYQRGSDEKEAAAFIKNEYGTGGRSFDFLDGTHGFVDYRPSSGMIFNPYGDGEKVTLKWPAVEKRLREIIREGSYLTEDEKAQYQELESSYAGLGSIPMPQPQTAFPQPQAHAMPEKVESSPDEAITQSDIKQPSSAGTVTMTAGSAFRHIWRNMPATSRLRPGLPVNTARPAQKRFSLPVQAPIRPRKFPGRRFSGCLPAW